MKTERAVSEAKGAEEHTKKL